MSWRADWKAHKAFFIPVLIFILTGIVFLSLYSKEQIHLTQNAWFSPASDWFFKYFTHLGDGLVFAFALPIVLWKSWRSTIGLAIAAILTLFISAGLKEVYKEEARPVKYFEGKAELHLVEGVHNHHYKSFPSGHTTTAFACWGFIALVISGASIKFLLATIAILAGYSRIHISQHFLVDVVAGAILGSIIAYIAYIFNRQFKADWSQKSLANLFKHK